MSSLKLGSTSITNAKLGSTQVSKIYQGTNLIWENSPSDPYLKVWVDAGNASSYSGTGTTWYDLSGNGNNLTLAGSPSYDATTGSFYFPNSTSVYASNTSMTGTSVPSGTDCTLEIWHRYKGPVDNTYYSPFEWGIRNDPNYDLGGFYAAWVDSGFNGYALESQYGGIRLQYNLPAYGSTAYWNKTTGYNVWIQHVMVRQSNGTALLYINNSLIASVGSFYNGAINQSTKLYVGTNNPANPFGGSLPYYGDVAIVKIWNGKALNSTEIASNWNASKARFGH